MWSDSSLVDAKSSLLMDLVDIVAIMVVLYFEKRYTVSGIRTGFRDDVADSQLSCADVGKVPPYPLAWARS